MRESNAIFPEIKYDLRKCLECECMPSEPHGEGDHWEIFSKGKWPKDEMPSDDDDRPTAFPLHNNEPELIDYFVSPLGSANQSVLPEWLRDMGEPPRATCESRCRLLCMLRRTNTG